MTALNDTQSRIVAYVSANEPALFSDICTAVGRSQGVVSKALTLLETRRIVVRKRDHRTRMWVSLTKAEVGR
jgi:DNA-binding MarR family transcriptional regulator